MKHLNEEIAKESTLKYFDGDELATNVWLEKYALRDRDNNLLEETPDDTIKRVANELYRIELTYPNPLSYEEIYLLLQNFGYFIPGGSILYGCGNSYVFSSLGQCFVIGDNYDSYGGILRNDEQLVQLMKRRGGVGLDLSHLRPSGSKVSNAAKSSTGVVSFAERYSNSTKEVAQSGRRGALMLTLNIEHPDIISFIKSKEDKTKITRANISVKVTDNFIHKLVQGDKYSKKVWKELTNQAYKNAEPGVLFWDTILRESPTEPYEEFKNIAPNPCSELILCEFDSCRLGSINLFSCVKNPFTKDAYFNFLIFKDVVNKSQRLMDDIVDLEEEKILAIINKINSDPEPDDIKSVELNLWTRILDKLLKGRRTGLGLLGFADCLAALGIKYDSDEAIQFSVKMAKEFAISSYSSSITMATERGCFKAYDNQKDFESAYTKRIFKKLDEVTQSKWKHVGRRNIANLAIAPTGTLSLLTRTSSGIEPVFRLTYGRRKRSASGDNWETFQVMHPKLKLWQDITGEKDITKSPYYTSTTDKINQFEKLRIQGNIQKWIDHSISVTYNLPTDIAKGVVDDIYYKAWQYGCKGCTIYREGSRKGVLLSDEVVDFEPHSSPKRPKSVQCDVFYPTIKGEQYIVIVGVLGEYPYELFCFKQNGIEVLGHIKNGYTRRLRRGFYNLLNTEKELIIEDIGSKFERPDEEFATRMISTALRHGASAKFVVEQLDKSKGELFNFNKVIARVLKKYIKDGDKMTGTTCPVCGSETLIYQEGCAACSCGYSKC